jgi:hypothetical protein
MGKIDTWIQGTGKPNEQGLKSRQGVASRLIRVPLALSPILRFGLLNLRLGEEVLL